MINFIQMFTFETNEITHQRIYWIQSLDSKASKHSLKVSNNAKPKPLVKYFNTLSERLFPSIADSDKSDSKIRRTFILSRKTRFVYANFDDILNVQTFIVYSLGFDIVSI